MYKSARLFDPIASSIQVNEFTKCSYPNINGCRTCSQDNLMRSFFNSHGQLSEPNFSKFLDKEICSGDLCEEMLVNADIFGLSSLLRELIGEGSHRQLVTTMELYHHPKFTHFVNEHFCEAIVIEYLPTGVFSDPFELQRLVDREVFLSASVFGDTNLELPSALSNISVVEIHINVKSDAQKIVVQLPLHSRYPPLNSSDYISLTIGKPHLFIRCKPKISGTAACSWTVIDLGVLYGNNVTWRIPCGDAVHTRAEMIGQVHFLKLQNRRLHVYS
ncbi:phosphatidylinositol-glycan biosynthesis class X protein-like [Dendrobium catenatum]|uniref:phosphatidylinositol-glycan biosynthesis class X protein-like n=1 Tax=Dendrobium catenatum TaxID=906689 RepID=UPI00109FA5DA|nr:phosphatidylinositol-glycan biosynthesis class X protein-like [Dendrobium catenatum]